MVVLHYTFSLGWKRLQLQLLFTFGLKSFIKGSCQQSTKLGFRCEIEAQTDSQWAIVPDFSLHFFRAMWSGNLTQKQPANFSIEAKYCDSSLCWNTVKRSDENWSRNVFVSMNTLGFYSCWQSSEEYKFFSLCTKEGSLWCNALSLRSGDQIMKMENCTNICVIVLEPLLKELE